MADLAKGHAKILALGALAASPTDTYAVTVGHEAIVTKIRIRNTGASTRVVSAGMRIGSGTPPYSVWPDVTLATKESVEYLANEGPLSMGSDGRIFISQDAGTDCHYVISGMET